jgi:pilus assembly protein CpaB
MKPTSIVLLLVAVIAGGLAAYLATQQSGPTRTVSGPTVVVEEKKTQILVAVAPIGVGERLSAVSVKWADWPEGAVRKEYITQANMPDALDQVSGAVARFEIFPGDPILEQKLVRTGQGYLSAVLDKGKRGISVAVDATSASGGFIVPNDHVDIVLTRDSGTGPVSETILRNVKVIAIGARLGEVGTTGAPADPDAPNAIFDAAIATLELDPLQGETVINAAKIGTISLALRSIADFSAQTEDTSKKNNQNVRLIRFGSDTTVMAGQNQPAAVEPASFGANPEETIQPPLVEEPVAPVVEAE